MALSISKGGLKLPQDVFRLTDELARRRGVEPATALRDALTAALAVTSSAPGQDAEADVRDALAIASGMRARMPAQDRGDEAVLGYGSMFPNLYARE